MVAAVGVATAGVAAMPVRPARAADDEVRGFAITQANAPKDYRRLVQMGTNTLYLDAHWEADGPNANSVHPYSGTESEATLVGDMQAASAAGLRVALMPKVYCNGCDGGWRGNLNPSDPHAFMQSYTQMVLHYAQLAEQSHAWLMFLGSEMSYLQPYDDDWRQLAAQVRQVFSGLVTYQPNWDRTEQVHFWDALDMVTVSAYFPLTTTERPSVDELKKAWRSCNVPGWTGQDWIAILQRIVNATGKRLLVGEVGYRSSTIAAAHPWDEVDQSQTPDQVTQANAYQALLETFSSEPWFMGVIWWQWRGDDQGAGNTDMSPLGKQAEQLLTMWWAEGWRPTPASPTPVYKTPGSSGGPGGSAPGRGGSVLAARTPGSTAATKNGATSTSGSTSTAPLTPGDAAAVDSSGLVNGNGHSLALGPKPAARSGRGSGSRTVLVGFALVGLLGMGAGALNLARVRLRTPRPRPLV